MLNQTLEKPAFDVRNISTPPVFLHLVTLIKRSTNEEVCLHIETLSDRFVDVMREVAHQKAIHKLFGYEIFEILDCNEPPF
jgi:hypothetical protein